MGENVPFWAMAHAGAETFITFCAIGLAVQIRSSVVDAPVKINNLNNQEQGAGAKPFGPSSSAANQAVWPQGMMPPQNQVAPADVKQPIQTVQDQGSAQRAGNKDKYDDDDDDDDGGRGGRKSRRKGRKSRGGGSRRSKKSRKKKSKRKKKGRSGSSRKSKRKKGRR